MKAFLFVDGSNLYAGQYDLFGPERYLDFGEFIKEVESKLKIKFEKKYFYASYSPIPRRVTRKVVAYLKNEHLFYRSVRQVKDLIFFKGHRSPTTGKEKAVDVALAADIVRYSCEKKFDSAWVVTGDADFKHCLDIAKEKGRKISILTIENRIPFRLSLFYPADVFWYQKKAICSVQNKIKWFKGSRLSVRAT